MDYLSALPYLSVAGVGLYFLRRYMQGGVCRSTARLDGKTVIVTGSNTGIGKATAQDLAARGARVILACRDMTKAEAAATDIRQATGNGNVVAEKLDLASLASVRAFAERINKEEDRLDILINNAGVMWCPRQESADGYELQFAVNHLGHFLLTNLLLDKLKHSAPSRVVNVSSYGHQAGKINFDDLNGENVYSPYQAYFQSKLANIMFTSELAKRLKGSGVTAYSLNPGNVDTELPRSLSDTFGPVLYALAWPFFKLGQLTALKTPMQGAQTSIHCAVSEGLESSSGLYFSDCAVLEPASQAKDESVARRLWDVSEELVGIRK